MIDLDSLKALLDAAPSSDAKAEITRRARDHARKHDLAIPDWAVFARAKFNAPTSGGQRHTRSRVKAGAPGVISSVVPRALSEWRARTPGACIQLRQGEIVLHVLGSQPKRFKSIDAAVAAIAV